VVASSRCERRLALPAADLLALISVEPGRTDALDWFIGSCLCEGGIWESPRTSDGINAIERVLERGPAALRVAGRIWEIDQSLHTFWLELKRNDGSDRFAWSLYFDVIETSARRARNALSSHEDAEEIEWRAKLMGQATAQNDKLTIVPGSTRAEVRDVAEPDVSAQDEWRRSRRRR
jgi:hypothetical protein